MTTARKIGAAVLATVMTVGYAASSRVVHGEGVWDGDASVSLFLVILFVLFAVASLALPKPERSVRNVEHPRREGD